MVKRIILFEFFVIFLILLAGCSTDSNVKSEGESEKRVIHIGYVPTTHAAPLFLQNEKQYENYEMELVAYGTWPELMDALNTGRIDGASVLTPLAMMAKEKGIDLKAVARSHRDGNVFIVSPEIHSLEDLKGKTIAIPSSLSTQNVLLYQLLKQNGIDDEELNIISLSPADMSAALVQGQIAGYIVAEPVGAISVILEKGKVLYSSQDIWKNAIDSSLVLQHRFIEENRELAKQFVQDYAKAGEVTQKKDEHVHKVISQYIDVDDEVLDLLLQWISYDNVMIEEEAYNILVDSLKEMGLTESPSSYEEFVDISLLE